MCFAKVHNCPETALKNIFPKDSKSFSIAKILSQANFLMKQEVQLIVWSQKLGLQLHLMIFVVLVLRDGEGLIPQHLVSGKG